MGWFNRAATVVNTADALAAEMRGVTPSPSVLSVPTWSEHQAFGALVAGQVAAFTRALRLISGTVAQLPLYEWQGDSRARLIDRLEASATYWVTMQRTVEDVCLYARAYWKILALGPDGYPSLYELLPAADTVQMNAREVRYSDVTMTIQHPDAPPAVGRVVVFTGYRDGVLLAGAETIMTAVAIERAARNYAEVPAPAQILTNTSNYELSDTEITELLTAYTDARRGSSVAYLNAGVSLDTLGYTPNDLQLSDARNGSATAIARLFNLDPMWVGAGVPGSSLTYQNRVDARTDLYTFTLSDYLSPIEQRMSMPDMAAGIVRFDSSEFLRSNLESRVQMVNTLVPLGVMTVDQAQSFIADKPIPEGPYA